ncbi:hypothetical protein XA68_17961 [Ophiocordyceps unilateralis]|uniref:Uncharacterized protein n=1 Tax=Ophiocordyceps unilateralis TaxID=268505 RepID=A0A2A9PK62_OPHUN|nr:hypothetical protein XA68_17961 [Ophiocordyceps unilateralis]
MTVAPTGKAAAHDQMAKGGNRDSNYPGSGLEHWTWTRFKFGLSCHSSAPLNQYLVLDQYDKYESIRTPQGTGVKCPCLDACS